MCKKRFIEIQILVSVHIYNYFYILKSSYSSGLTSSLWSTVIRETNPLGDSRMHRESPTNATVTVQQSIITKVTVVPNVCPVKH